jgi:hypothetical protein
MSPAERLLCAIISGEKIALSSHDDRWEGLIESAFHHQLHLILFECAQRSSSIQWPLRLRELVENDAVTACVLDLIQQQELRRVLVRFDESKIRPLLLKGVPLAYSLYRSSALRPRGDIDLLVRESELKLASQILIELGYDGSLPQLDMLTSYECLFKRTDALGANHYLDIHWKINNAQIFANTMSFDELEAEAIEIPSLASCAVGLGHVHALLLACMHRFTHYHAPFYSQETAIYAGDHLRWVYDIHLLCTAMNAIQWSAFTAQANTKQIVEFCFDGLSAAKEAFGTQIPAEAFGMLQTAASNETRKAQSLKASGAAWFFSNLRALPSFRKRIKLIKQIALPPPEYMMAKYKANSRLSLAFLYGYRLANGALRTITRK